MIRPWHICVLIPARNEEDLLPRCLASVREARNRLPPHVTCDTVVAVDASTDRTAHIAQELLAGHGAVTVIHAGMVGRARATAVRHALKRYKGLLSLCWLAHTDADCVVPEDWLLKQLLLADKGIEAFAGIVSVDSFHEHTAGVEERFRDVYLLGSDGTHQHVHGANLGVRADAYRRSGGWANLATAEDHDLWNRLAAFPRISTTTIQVVTSGRRIGRAPHGFAEALAAHSEVIP